MTDININEVYEELKYLGELPETSRLIKDYLALREENEKLRSLVKELADALLVMNNLGCLVCASRHKTDCMKGDYCDRMIGNNALVAKARKEVGA